MLHPLQVVRCGASELHVTGAIVGGIAAQEAIKLITRQFVPLQGYLIFDGIHGATHMLNW